MLTGDNSILQKATEAKEQTDIAQEKETIALAYNSALAKKVGNGISTPVTSEDMNTELTNQGATASGSNPITVTFTTNGHFYTIDSNGRIEQIPEANRILAITASKTTISVGETIQLVPSLEPNNSIGAIEYSSSNTSIATVSSLGVVTGIDKGTVTITASLKGTSKSISITVEKVEMAIDKLLINNSTSPYVYYPAKDGSLSNRILCKVLYDKNSENGLQIVAVNPVTTVKIGYTDENPNVTGSDNFRKSLNSYNRAIQTLNEEAEKYLDNKGIASDARCIGSDPRPEHKNDESATISKSTKSYGYVQIRDTDTHYTSDETALNAVGLYTIDEIYWMASRIVTGANCCIRCADQSVGGTTGSANYHEICSVNSKGRVNSAYGEEGLRPVFYITSNARITGGNGTSGNPYVIDI